MNHRVWTCPYCGSKTKPIAFKEQDVKDRVKRFIVIVQCEKCSRRWVDEL